MNPSPFGLLLLLACSALADRSFALQPVSRDFQPVSGPLRHAGTLHVATGTWTRPAEREATSATLAGATMDSLYACTVPSGCSAPQDPGEVRTIPGRIPSTSSPTTLWNPASVPAVVGSSAGCADAYQIDAFQIGDCTAHAGPTVRATVAFFQSRLAHRVVTRTPRKRGVDAHSGFAKTRARRKLPSA